MLKQIYEKIKQFDTIVIARHIGVDPDALGSQFALKAAINLNFPEKKVYAVGTKSSRYNYFPKLDKYEKQLNDDVLLIVVDTPDKKRVDIQYLDTYPNACKIDHHPFIDKIGEYEYIDTSASSASELVLRFFKENSIPINNEIAEYLYYGIVSDTNRFLFNTSSDTFKMVEELTRNYNLDIEKIYSNLKENGIECILDDREDLSIGAKIKDAKVLGTPYMVVLGDKMEGEILEVEDIKTGEKTTLDLQRLINLLK